MSGRCGIVAFMAPISGLPMPSSSFRNESSSGGVVHSWLRQVPCRDPWGWNTSRGHLEGPSKPSRILSMRPQRESSGSDV